MNDPIVIIGAGRSGTNALRDALSSMSTFHTWPCDEINYIWRHGNRDLLNDEFTVENATPEIGSFIQEAFNRRAAKDPSAIVVEKTCANSLRPGFVMAAVPNAKIVHISRDARDVVASAMHRWTATIDLPYIARKARYVPVSDLPHYAFRYLKSRADRLRSGERQLSTWGPRFADLDQLVADRTPLHQICAHQWLACATRSQEGLGHLDSDRVISITYRDLVTTPTETLARVADFAGQSATADVAAAASTLHSGSLGTGQRNLSTDQLDDIEAICGPMQRSLGFQS